MVPHDQQPEVDAGQQVADMLRDFFQRSHRAIDRKMAAHGASYARARLLMELAAQGPMRSTDLAASFNFAPRTITEAVDGLERDGLARRGLDPADRRAKRISLTAAGTAAADGAERARLAYVEEVFGALPEAELRELARLLAKLNARLAAIGG